MINPRDTKDGVLVAGGPSHALVRANCAVREAIAQDASATDRLFASKDVLKIYGYPGCDGRNRPHERNGQGRRPRGFDPAHPRMDCCFRSYAS